MNDWRIIVVAVVAGILVWATIENRLASTIRLRRLKKSNRCISATDAINEYQSGLGLLVHNRSLLPGDWWFLRKKDRPKDCDLVTAMDEFGHVVVCKDAEERQAIENFKGKVEEMLEPFD